MPIFLKRVSLQSVETGQSHLKGVSVSFVQDCDCPWNGAWESGIVCTHCFSDLDPCINATCDFHGVCKAFGPYDPRCICVPSCPSYEVPVCSSKGKTYDNECKYRQDMCKLKANYTIYHPGDCAGNYPPIMKRFFEYRFQSIGFIFISQGGNFKF